MNTSKCNRLTLLHFKGLTGSNLAVCGRWLDKLGVAAKMGINVVARQSFFHGHYALLDDYMYPRPVCSHRNYL